MHILVTGASGSGTSTLAAVMADGYDALHIEVDDFFWKPTDPPYQERRSKEDRLSHLLAKMAEYPRTICAGSVSGWGLDLENGFDAIVFLYLDASIRLDRLREREMQRFGKADPEFLEWAGQYDRSPTEGRSFAKQDAWLKSRTCPVLRIVGDLSVHERLQRAKELVSNRVLKRTAASGAESGCARTDPDPIDRSAPGFGRG